MRNIEIFKKHLREKRAVKIDCGMDNFDLELIKKVALSAQEALASAIDVPASKDVIKVAKENTRLTIFASSIHPFKLLEAVKAGADAIEIGNYESLYKEGTFLSANDVYEIAMEVIDLTKKFNPYICVTIPAHLDITEQVELAKKLELIGVDLIQTESYARKEAVHIKGSADSAKTSIMNTMEISENIGIPVMTSSGLSPQTVPLAFVSGAQAVSIDACVTKMDTKVGMVAIIRNIVGSIAFNRQASQELKNESIKMEFSSPYL
ncbi:MAG: DUF561 domain-containing protein [Cyanobacteria bacterium SIG30]|nr:DUF561 domain-containing protein [Cyanobacteria bacterium SIG30]